jgi:hypothetical protein
MEISRFYHRSSFTCYRSGQKFRPREGTVKFPQTAASLCRFFAHLFVREMTAMTEWDVHRHGRHAMTER